MHRPFSLAFGSLPIRLLSAIAIVLSLITSSIAPAFAAGGQTGNVQGTVVDATTGAAISGVKVTLTSPSGSYTTTTNAQGFFSVLGLNVDTYVASAQIQGYESASLNGVTIPGDQNLNLGRIQLTPTAKLRTVARVTSRSLSGAYQPGQTTDSYTVAGDRILQSVGKSDTTNENNIILAIPGVSLTDSGVPTIRGGSPTEVGFQLDGIPFSEPFLNMNASSNRVNGLGSIQVVEGAGDATQGDVGSGVVNVIPKRGTNPASGTVDFEVGGPNFDHQFAVDYGFATPKGNFSNYFSYIGQRYDPYLGYHTTNVQAYGNSFGDSYNSEDQLLDNAVFKFGHNNSQSLQVLYSNQNILDYGNAGGVVTNPNDPEGSLQYYPYSPLSGNELIGASSFPNYANLVGLSTGVPSNPNEPINSAEINNATQTRFLKFEYDNNLDASTFLALRYFNWETLTQTQADYSVPVSSVTAYQNIGGARTGGILDLTHQFGSKLTLSLNGEYQVLRPVWNLNEPQVEFFSSFGTTQTSANTPSYGDFLPGGYVYNYFTAKGEAVPRIPDWGIDYHGAIFQEYGAGLRIQYAPTTRLKFDLGARNEQQFQKFYNPYNQNGNPNNPFDVLPQSFNDSSIDPHVFQPRGSVSYQLGANDSVRAGYGRSAVFVNAQTAGTPFGPSNLAVFNQLAPLGGTNATCGLANFGGTFKCANYAEQLYWQGDAVEAPDAGGSRPAIYSNYDFTYQHQFANGFGLHVTPFYKLGTDLPAASLIATLAGGQQIFGVTDAGFNRTTGLEFELTTPTRPYGFSGFFSATYQNVLQSAPPLSNGEDTEPQLSVATLALGDTYRAGYVSPLNIRIGGTYKTKGGFSVTPVVQYDRGYPYSVGNLIAAQLPNGTFANIPQVNFGGGVTPLVGYQNQQGTSISTNYYDPADPGSSLKPNIAATRGTPATSVNGGALFKPNVEANLTTEYHIGRNVIGASAINLLGNAFNGSIPLVNPYYQPVANGLSGPLTGLNPNLAAYGSIRNGSNIPHDTYAFTNGAYLLSQGTSQVLAPLQPTTFTLYYQYKI